MQTLKWMNVREVLSGATVALLLAACPASAQQLPSPAVYDFDPAAWPVWGVDVSHHQHHIDWRALAREPRVKFAYMKATQGVTLTDPKFSRNWKGARRAGLRTGAYHYYSFCSEPLAQAHHFLAVVPRARDALPAVLDIEHLFNCAPDPDPAKVRAALLVWLSAVESATQQRPIVYATADILADYFIGSDLDYPLWVRHTREDPEPVLSLPWQLLQFDDQTACTGVAGAVDRDVFRGDESSLAKLGSRGPARKLHMRSEE